MASIFKFARLLAGLALKFRKCCLVPVRPWSGDRAATMRSWIAGRLPDWIAVAIAPVAKYIGAHLGTIVGNHLRRAPAEQYHSRVSAIAATGAPTTPVTVLFCIKPTPSPPSGIWDNLAVPPNGCVKKCMPFIVFFTSQPISSLARIRSVSIYAVRQTSAVCWLILFQD